MSIHMRQFDWRKAILHGIDLAAENFREHEDAAPYTAMWELLREAAGISRSFDAPPRTGYPEKAMWPETPDEITPWQRQMAYLQGTLDEVDHGEPPPPMPSAADVTRAEAVLDLWHRHALWRGGHPHPHKRAIYRWADGGTLGLAIRMTGLRRHEVLALRQRAAEQMLRAIL